MIKFLVLFTCLVAPSLIQADKELNELIKQDPDFTTLRSMMKAARNNMTSEGKWRNQPVTRLLPTNKAFEKIKKEDLDQLMKDPVALKKILQRHIIPGKITSAELKSGPVTTVSKETLTVNVSADKKVITFASGSSKARVVKADIAAGNSVAHGIDTVLLD